MKRGYYFIFSNGQLLIDVNSSSVPQFDECPQWIDRQNRHLHHTGSVDGVDCFVANSSQIPSGDNYKLMSLRATVDLLDPNVYAMAGRAWQILFWDINTVYCPTCGEKTKHVLPLAKTCPKCKRDIYPTISPATIVLVKRGEDEILMVRALNFRGDHYGLVAGFLEVGESLEECVQRELMEETAIKVKNIKYYGSQAWPYPSGMMIGFTADYESGDIVVQK